MKAGIYLISNIANGKVYIGKAVDIKRRWATHKAHLRGNRHINGHLNAAWQKYGEESFTFKVLEYCLIEELGIRETYFVKAFDATNPENGYNLTEPTLEGGFKHSEESKRKMSKPKSLEHRRKIAESHKGKKLSQSHLLSMSAARKGMVAWSMDFKFLSPDGVLFEGTNIKEFCRLKNLDNSGMCKLVKGNLKSYKGWRKAN